MIFEQLNPGACRTYLIGDEQSQQAILVDPVLEHVPLESIKQESGLSPSACGPWQHELWVPSCATRFCR